MNLPPSIIIGKLGAKTITVNLTARRRVQKSPSDSAMLLTTSRMITSQLEGRTLSTLLRENISKCQIKLSN